MRRPDGGQRGPRRRGGPDARPRHLVRLGKDRRRRLPRPQQRRGQLRGRGLPHGDRAPDRGRRTLADGRSPHVRRVPEGDGPVDRRDEADLRDPARCAPTSLLRDPRRHPEGGASRGGTGRVGARTAARGRLRPGGDLMSEEIVSELMRAHVYRLASTGQRVDGRRLDEPRKLSVARTFVKTAEGSARVQLGNTDVLVGVKMSVGEPYPDTPNTGVLSTSVELIPMASPTFEAGPPRPDAIELARVVDRGIRESKMVNMEKLCITPKEKVWILFIDIHVLDFDGNLFDACSYAAVSALASTIAPAARSFNPPEILHGPSHAKGRHRRPFRPPLRGANPSPSPRNRGGPERAAHMSAVRRDLGPPEVDGRLGVPPMRLRLRRRGLPADRDDLVQARGHGDRAEAGNEGGGGLTCTSARSAWSRSGRTSTRSGFSASVAARRCSTKSVRT